MSMTDPEDLEAFVTGHGSRPLGGVDGLERSRACEQRHRLRDRIDGDLHWRGEVLGTFVMRYLPAV